MIITVGGVALLLFCAEVHLKLRYSICSFRGGRVQAVVRLVKQWLCAFSEFEIKAVRRSIFIVIQGPAYQLEQISRVDG